MLSTPALVLAIMLFGLGLVGLIESTEHSVHAAVARNHVECRRVSRSLPEGARWGQVDGEIMFLFILTLAAAEVSVALGIVLQLSYRFRTLDADAFCEMRG